MKTPFIILNVLLGVLLFSLSPLYADTQIQPSMEWRKIQIQPAVTEMRSQFSENEPVQIELTEHFPNMCYRPAPVESQVDIENRRIVLRDYAFYPVGGLCPMVITPRQRTVEIGQLPSGIWELWVVSDQGGTDKAGEFTVN